MLKRILDYTSLIISATPRSIILYVTPLREEYLAGLLRRIQGRFCILASRKNANKAKFEVGLLDVRENIDLIICQDNRIPIRDETIDIVTCFNRLLYPQDFVREVRRVLRPHGKMIVTAVNLLSYRGLKRLFDLRYDNPLTSTPFTLRRLLRSYGFEILKIFGLKHIKYYGKMLIAWLFKYWLKQKGPYIYYVDRAQIDLGAEPPLGLTGDVIFVYAKRS